MDEQAVRRTAPGLWTRRVRLSGISVSARRAISGFSWVNRGIAPVSVMRRRARDARGGGSEVRGLRVPGSTGEVRAAPWRYPERRQAGARVPGAGVVAPVMLGVSHNRHAGSAAVLDLRPQGEPRVGRSQDRAPRARAAGMGVAEEVGESDSVGMSRLGEVAGNMADQSQRQRAQADDLARKMRLEVFR